MRSEITVLIPTFNRPQKLKRALESLINQSYQNFRVVVVDNASDDNTADIVKAYSENRVIQYSRNESNLGIQGNLIKSLSFVKTEYFCWLADDDFFIDRHYFLKAQKFLQETTPPGVIYGGRVLYDEGLKKNRRKNSANIDIRFSGVCDWVIRRQASQVLNMSGVLVKYREEFKCLIDKDPGAGWGLDDAIYATAAEAGVVEMAGDSIAMSVNVADNTVAKEKQVDILHSARHTKAYILKLIENTCESERLKMLAKKTINIRYSDWNFFKSYAVKRAVCPARYPQSTLAFIKEHRSNFEGGVGYLLSIFFLLIAERLPTRLVKLLTQRGASVEGK